MYTVESSYQEVCAAAKAAGIAIKGVKKLTLIEELNKLEMAASVSTETGEVKQKGRPINPESARQQRLSIVKTGQRGRPANPESAWYKRQAELAAKREAGELKLGRAVNPESARQKRLALKGTLPLGRPKAKVEAPVEPVVPEPEQQS